MKESSHSFSLLNEGVVAFNRLLGSLHQNFYVFILEIRDGLLINFEAQHHASAEDDDPAAMIEQLLAITDLNTVRVTGTVFVPIPVSTTTWPKLEIFAHAQTFNLHPSPFDRED